jgi:hypothetical protein
MIHKSAYTGLEANLNVRGKKPTTDRLYDDAGAVGSKMLKFSFKKYLGGGGGGVVLNWFFRGVGGVQLGV